jgi:IMP dehydrogenase/GMP reductase
MKQYLKSFDQLRIIQQVSRINSRGEDCDTSVEFGGFNFELPLISAAMHSLVNAEFVENMEKWGSGVVQPRDVFYPSNKPMYNTSLSSSLNVAAQLNDMGKGILFLEVAHGAMIKVAHKVEEIKNKYPNVFLCVGTIDNYETASFLDSYGVDGVLVNIGNGSVCETTPFTGVGLPLVASLMDIQENGGLNAKVIVSGGIRNSGDFIKCLALGADIVMSGSLFKNCRDSEVYNTDTYYGEASEKGKGNNTHVEGKVEIVRNFDKTSNEVLQFCKESLQSSMSYSNSKNLAEFRNRVKLGQLC